MGPYLAIASARFRTLLQYRGAAAAGVLTQGFFGAVRIMVLAAFYRSSTAAQPLSFEEAVGYIWLGQATLAMFPWNTDREAREAVRSGAVTYELCRPLDLYALWFFRGMAARLAPMLLRCVPMFVIAMAVLPAIGFAEWRLRLPADGLTAAAWLATMLGALMLSCAMTMVMNLSLLWTVSGKGISTLVGSMASLLGGMVIPLPLFPQWARPLVQTLPFAGAMDFPARVYTGNIEVGGVGWVLLHQFGWTAVLVSLGRWLLPRGLKQLPVQGG